MRHRYSAIIILRDFREQMNLCRVRDLYSRQNIVLALQRVNLESRYEKREGIRNKNGTEMGK